MKKMCVTAAVMLTAVLSGCGHENGNGSEAAEGPVSVSVVVGAHSNANVLSANAEAIREPVYQCAYTYGTVSLIRADGKPEEFFRASVPKPSIEGLSDRKLQSIAEGYQDEILAVLTEDGAARYEEVDTLEAIRLAANTLKNVEGGERYLLVADTGLATCGYLNFCEDDLFNTPTDEIVSALEEQKAVPDLEGVKVVWLYAGETGEPQASLSEVQKDKLIEIWTAVLEAGGAASTHFREGAASAEAYSGLPEVSEVRADEREIDVEPLKAIMLDGESVSFIGDEAVFSDKEQAERAISSVAETLLDHPDNKVYVVGCTASSTGREDFCQELSEARAEAVAEILKKHGVPDGQMEVMGVGDRAPWRVEDLDENGCQIEEYAQQNRCVVVLDTQDPEYGRALAASIKE